MAFGYYSPVTVNAAQVPSAQTNFPMLVSYTDARLKTVGNGGHVQNANGYDIRPYDGIGGSAMTFELERYNASTGEVIMWVLVPSCDVGSIVYLYYGDATISTNGSSTSTWNSNFKGVWHLPDGTTLGALDSVSSPVNGTVTGATAVAGKIDGAANFSGTQYISFGNGSFTKIDGATECSVSCIVRTTSLSNFQVIVSSWNNGVSEFKWMLFIGTSGEIYFQINTAAGGSTYINGTATHLSINTTYFITATWVAATNTMKCYINGTVDATGTTTLGTPPSSIVNAPNTSLRISTDQNNGGANTYPVVGWVDEVNVLNVAISQNWETTKYNNQSAPSTFATLGAEVSLLNQTNFFRMFN